MSRGVFAGMNTAYQTVVSALTKPRSPGVGTLGRSEARVAVDTISGTTRPSRISGSAVEIGVNRKSMRPPSKSVSASAPPLYGTCVV